MKLLTFLGVAQTALILILLIKVIDLDRRADAGVTSVRNPVPGEIVALPKADSPRPLDEGRLRQIVREELAALLNTFSNSAPHSAAGKGPAPVSAAEYQYRLDAVMQNLDYYIGQGKISDTDMTKFQAEIARLDDEGRRQMLSLLSQAISSGELDGHF